MPGLWPGGARPEIHPDGVGSFTATGSSERVAAAMTRIDALARRARAAGVHPGRSLAQLRSDITFDRSYTADAGHPTTPPARRMLLGRSWTGPGWVNPLRPGSTSSSR